MARKEPRLDVSHKDVLIPAVAAMNRFQANPTTSTRDALLEAIEPLREAQPLDPGSRPLAGGREDERVTKERAAAERAKKKAEKKADKAQGKSPDAAESRQSDEPPAAERSGGDSEKGAAAVEGAHAADGSEPTPAAKG